MYPIHHYLNVRNAYFAGFSGEGARIVFVSDLSGVPQVWQVPAEAGAHPWWPEQLTFAEERVLGVSPAPGGDQAIYARDVGGNEKAQLFLLDTARGGERLLTAGYDEAMHGFGCWAPDGQAIYFAANRRHPARFDLYRLRLDEEEATMLWENDRPGYLAQMAVSDDGQRLAFNRAASSFDHDLFLFDLGRQEARPVAAGEEWATFEALAFAPGGRTLYVVTDRESDFLHLRRLDVATGTWETLLAPNWDVETMALSTDGRYLAVTINIEGASRLELIDMLTGTARPGPEVGVTPGIVGWMDLRLAFDPAGERLVFSHMSAMQSSDVYVWDVKGDTLQQVTASGSGGIDPATFVAPELIHYPTFDERDIPAWYFRPATGEGPRPVVVLVHGGPESQTRPAFNPLAQYLAHHGYAVLAPNVRGSTGYGKAYSHLDDVEKRMDSVADLAHAARWLGEQAEIDRERIAVYGGSYGGFMVLAALTNYPELWAAAVDVVGISNFVTFLENTSDYRRAHREAEYGSLAEHREFLESIAPMNKLAAIRAPLLVIHGANDPRVPLSEAEQLVEALQAREVPVEFLVFDDEGHGIVRLKNKLVAYPAVVTFLDRYL
ncbi:MAG: S9 family peptidase [Anaerolineae bacterium]|nr:S9 family peptidase [Anaerolineae bacterium]